MNAATDLSVSPWHAWASFNACEQAAAGNSAARGDAFARLLDPRWSPEQAPADPRSRHAAEPAVGGSDGSPRPASHPHSRPSVPREEERCDGAPALADDAGITGGEEPPRSDGARIPAEENDGSEDAPTDPAAGANAAVALPVPPCAPPPPPQPAASPAGPGTPPDASPTDASPPVGAGATIDSAGSPQVGGAAARTGGAPPMAADVDAAPPAIAVEQLAGPVQSRAGPLVVTPAGPAAPTAGNAAPTGTALAAVAAAAGATGDAAAAADAGAGPAGGDVDAAAALSQAAQSGDAGGQDQQAGAGQDFAGGGAAGQTAAMSRAEAAHAAPEPPPSPAAQLAEPLVRAARAGVHRVEIALEPAALGRIDVRLDFATDGRMSALIMADSPQALDALRADAQTLTRALADAGIDGGGLDFGLRQRDPGSDGGGFARASGSSGGAAGSGGGGPPATARSASPTYSSPSGRLDIRA